MKLQVLLKKYFFGLAVFSLITCSSGALLAQSSTEVSGLKSQIIDFLIEQIDVLDQKVRTLEKAIYSQTTSDISIVEGESGSSSMQPALTRQSLQISEIENQMRMLTGQVEEVGFAMEQIKDYLSKFEREMEYRISSVESEKLFNNQQGTGTSSFSSTSNQIDPASQPQDLGTINVDEPEVEGIGVQEAYIVEQDTPALTIQILPEGTIIDQYEFAISLLRTGDYQSAEKGLSEFVEKFEGDDLAGSAQYWLGETYLVRERYPEAAKAFLKVYQSYPNNQKAPSSLLKLGIALSETGEKEQACLSLKAIEEEYPEKDLPVLGRAEIEIKKMECE